MISDLYIKLSNLKVRFEIKDGKLDIKAPKGVLTPELLNEIRAHKNGLLNFLSSFKHEEKNISHIIPIRHQPSYTLSSSQRRLWILSQFDGNIAYNVSGVFFLEGTLNKNALDYALAQLVERHEILRTIFKEDDENDVRQYIIDADQLELNVSYKDLRETLEPEKELKILLDKEISKPFNLSEGPLFRMGLYKVDSNKWAFSYVMHHIISDSWSMGILIKEILKLYNSKMSGLPNPLPVLKIQYKDYAFWEQNQLKSDELKSHKDYWLKQLGGDITSLNMPLDKVRPSIKTYNGGSIRNKINSQLTTQLKLLCGEQKSSLFMGLLAIVKILLYKYTGQEDMIIGSPIAGREHSDLEDQIGFYVNTLVLRTKFQETDNFLIILDKVKEIALEAYEHQAYPYDKLVDELQIKNDTSRNALFDVMVILQNGDTDRSRTQRLGDLQVSNHTLHEQLTSKFDLTFCFGEVEDGLQIVIEYNSDIYLKHSIERISQHLIKVLNIITKQPLLPVEQLEYLDEQEKNQLLNEFNSTCVEYSKKDTIVDLFQNQVKKTPDKIAVVFEDIKISYNELNEKSNQLANYLRSTYNIKADDLIAINLERSEWLVISILAILKSGGAYVPIDIDNPKDRIKVILDDIKCKVLLDLKELETFSKSKENHSKRDPKKINSPNDLAYIMYTSGTTGEPKGVMILHKGVIRLVTECNYLTLGENEILLSTGAISFDATTFEYWAMLLNGGALVLCKNEVLLDPKKLRAEIKDQKINTIWFTSDWLNELVDTDINLFQGLKTLLAGGDKLSSSHINRLRNKFPALKIVNGYGPTENTTFSLTFEIEHCQTSNIPIGKPINNTRVYILDTKQRLQPVGIIGEIYLSGEGLAKGYLNQPDLTDERFINSPFNIGEKIYRTGDLGRWLPDGNIEFIGRKDEQVKIRGYRIELGEIEVVLKTNPLIESAVVLLSDTSGEKELVAYLVSKTKLSHSEIISHISSKLPSYMIPSRFIHLERLPLTRTGKVDKKLLLNTSSNIIESKNDYVAPRNEIQKVLTSIWQETLSRQKIGINDNFFELGGHSLMAIRVAIAIRKELKIEISPKVLFSFNTIDLLSRMIETSLCNEAITHEFSHEIIL